MRQALIFFLFAIVVFQLEAQQQTNQSLWTEQHLPTTAPGILEKTNLSVSKSKIFRLNLTQLSQSLRKEFTLARNQNAELILPFPSPEGHLMRYRIRPSSTLHPDLANKFPNIQTFEGKGIDDPSATIRFEITQNGLTGMIWSAKNGTQVIHDTSDDKATNTYLVYYKKAASRQNATSFTCYTDDIEQEYLPKTQNGKARNSDGQLRTYRLVIAATGGYTAFHGGTKVNAMAAIATTINRVNGILKRDVATQLQLVANNDLAIFTDAATDGYTEDNVAQMLDENQTIIDNIIGNTNYDIGHVFSISEGGVAGLNALCSNTKKAQGVTGNANPQGDPFDVDYVAHEIGHQLGATHTQNNTCNEFIGTSVEPGSGSTIMGYAGICSPNIQFNSDDYYHSISIDQIKGFVSGARDDCAVKTATNNTPPVANAGADFIIPHSTPFELEGIASDSDNDALTYAWEQMNNELAAMPPLVTSSTGPLFRSFPPSNSPIRQFPAKGTNNNHSPSTWEVLPAVGRTMNFRFTVRDNFAGGGNTQKDDMEITVAQNSGPFKVLSPNGSEQMAAGITQDITWDVAGSNQTPVNCTHVDILLSVDGGNTYPIVLAENVVNDGAQDVLIPSSVNSNTARIKVKGHNNIFFDVSNGNFQITPAQPGFILNIVPNTVSSCQGNAAQIGINVEGVDGFSGNVDLSVDLPSAFPSFSLQTAIVSTGNSTNLTVNVGNATPVGIYDIIINGNSGDKSFSISVPLNVLAQNIATATLQEPTNNLQEVISTPTFTWTNVTAATKYQLEIALDHNFSSTIYTATDIATNSFALPFSLENGQTYFWRVQAANACGVGNYSNTNTFTVSNTLCQSSTNNQTFPITSESRTTIMSPIIIQEAGMVNGLTVNFDISHSWIGDLTVTLESPSGTKATILKEICGNEDRINLFFSNSGLAHNAIPCEPPVSENIYLPMESFNVFNGEEVNGTWKLIVTDDFVLDGGNLNNWNLEVCRGVEDAPPLNVLISNTTNPNCNGSTDGSIQATVIGGTPNYTIAWSNGANQLNLSNVSAGTYSVTVTDATGTSVNASTILSQPTMLELDAVIQDVACNGQTNGSIQVFPSGGTPSYQYNWANGVRQFNNLNLADGSYALTVTDDNGCTISNTYVVAEPSVIELSFTPTKAINGLNGSVDISVTGGIAPYTYSWSNEATTQDINELAPGNYTVTVTDDTGCSTTGSVSITNEITGQACYNVTIHITLDNYGEENRWELKNGNGELVEQLGPFNNFENGSVVTTNLCLPPGCYDFTIFDLWGDGMCCSYGQGGYEIIEDATEKVLASGGSYNRSETKTICLPSAITGINIDYCGANGRNTQYEWIETVEMAGQVFNSGNNNGYGDFVNTEILVPIGGTLDLALTPGFGFFEYHENWQVWIDFNRDGDFEDEGEEVFFTSGKERVTGTIGIPESAKSGKTRIRFAMKWGALITACESFSWGEVEDYTLNLQPLAKIGERVVSLTTPQPIFTTSPPLVYTVQDRAIHYDLKLYPNPTTDFIELEWQDNTAETYNLRIYDALGQIKKQLPLLTQEGLNKTRIKVNQLPAGIYLLSLQNKNKIITKEFVITK